MDPKIALTILPFALANFGSARNRVSDLQLTRIIRDLPALDFTPCLVPPASSALTSARNH